ncbi:MAG TPA: TRAP transporter substrate-binding protein [Ensifer sp.]|nr:TRAP transporter substrate-binding protein [Ensifer sp.]
MSERLSISRRTFMTGVAAATLGATTLAAPARAARAIKLRVSSSAPPERFGSHYLWFKPFQDELQRRVGDKIVLEYFPNGQLGKEADVVNQVRAGSVDMILTGTSIWANLVPEFGLLDLGFLFQSYDHCAKALDAGVGAAYDKMLQERTGVSVLGWGFQAGSRSIYTKKKITSVTELHGVKLRVLPTKAFIDTFNIIGATPTPIPINECYTAAQTGVVDGMEHDPGTVLAYKWDEVVKYGFLTRHIYTPLLSYIGKTGLSKIPDEHKKDFMEAAAFATASIRAEAPKVEAEAMDKLKAKGLEYTEVPKAELEDLRKRMASELYPAFLKQYPSTEPMFKTIKDLAAAQ